MTGKARRVLATLGAVALVLSILSITPTASAIHGNITVQVGAQLTDVPGQSMRFLAPRPIKVHQGEVITFKFQGWHTATLLPVGAGAESWLDANARGTGPYSLAIPDPDEGANAFKDNLPKVNTATSETCGRAGQTPCSYDGISVLSSGAPIDLPSTFSASIDAAPGSSFWVVSLFNHNMRIKVNVVENGTAATSQSAINNAKQAQIAQDQAWAVATHEEFSTKRSFSRTPSGDKIWNAWAGIDSPTASLLDFYPKRLKINKGDKVKWHWDKLNFQDHTTSLPVPAIFGIQFDEYACDPDGDDGTSPDTPPQGPFGDECPPGSELETDISSQFWAGTGDRTFRSMSDIEHSGIRGAQAREISPPAAGGNTWTVKFVKVTEEDPIKFFCFLLPMESTIQVNP
jgi:plastocyanin